MNAQNVDAATIQRALDLMGKQRERDKRHNAYIKENYKRITIAVPKNWDELLTKTGESVNGLIKRLLRDEFIRKGYMDNDGNIIE